MKKTVLILSLFVGIGSAYSQNVNIPDANFKAYLVGNTFINTNADTEISLSEAAAYNSTINCSGLGITDLTGIEAFTGYITLNCSNNSITTLDFSANVNMWNMLEVGSNPLTSLILPPNIESLKCQYTQLTSLDLSTAPNLTHVWSMWAPLTSINFSNSSGLIGLNIDGNAMSTIDLSNLTSLEWLNVTQSALTALDISPCPSVVSLNCSMSDYLTELNVANGNNMSFAPGNFNATYSPNLTCVTVDNVSFANAVWTSAVDPGVTFSLDCSSVVPLATSLTIEGQGGVSTITAPGGTLQMVPTILPIEAQGQNVIWGIAVGASLATIDANGLLTAIDNGVVTVGALTSDGSNIQASDDITISNQVVGLETLVDSKFTVHPNPAMTHIMIQTSDEIEMIKIYSSQGKLVQTEREKVFSVSQLDQGIYTIVLQTTNDISATRFIKM